MTSPGAPEQPCQRGRRYDSCRPLADALSRQLRLCTAEQSVRCDSSSLGFALVSRSSASHAMRRVNSMCLRSLFCCSCVRFTASSTWVFLSCLVLLIRWSDPPDVCSWSPRCTRMYRVLAKRVRGVFFRWVAESRPARSTRLATTASRSPGGPAAGRRPREGLLRPRGRWGQPWNMTR